MTGIADHRRVDVPETVVSVSESSIALTICLVTVTGVGWVLVDTPPSVRDSALPVFALGAGTMFGLALADIARKRELRFARVLVVSAVLWSLSALTASRAPLASSVGHVSQWLVDLAIVYLLLSYPSGRLTDTAGRVLFASGAVLIGVLFVPTALVAEFAHPSLWSTCTASCARNTFALGHWSPTLIHDVVLPARAALAVGLFAAIAAVVIRRAQNAGPLLGQLYAPVIAFAVVEAALFAVYFPLRSLAVDTATLSVVGWVFVLALPAAAVTCSTGRLYRRIHSANALDRITRDLRAGTSAVDVRRALADALHDPSLRILHVFPGGSRGWVDESGSPARLPQAGPARLVTRVSAGRWHIAILHDASLAQDRALLLSAGSQALAALENHCLADELNHSLRDLSATRARRLAAERDTRQKIERDLHDGAQQRLLALRLKLGLAATRLAGRDPAGAEAIRALEQDVDATIDEVRSLARGIYPSLLARTGLRDALRTAGRSAALPTIVRADGLGRYPAEIETTVYFSCSEALQNAGKHASSATGVTIAVWQDRVLHFEVRDDGIGFDMHTTPYGSGLNNLMDRLSAVGGTIRIRSAPGQGTVVAGEIPLA